MLAKTGSKVSLRETEQQIQQQNMAPKVMTTTCMIISARHSLYKCGELFGCIVKTKRCFVKQRLQGNNIRTENGYSLMGGWHS